MEWIFKDILQDVCKCARSQLDSVKILEMFLAEVASTGIIREFDVYTNGKWSIAVRYIDNNGHKQYMYCVNLDWFPVEGIFH